MFPMHPRTHARLADLDASAIPSSARLLLIEPLDYFDFLGLMMGEAVVITDSGGVQKETTFLGMPCVTVRTTTERPVTVTSGTNTLADPHDRAAILAAVYDAVGKGPAVPAPVIPLWDGHAGDRAVDALARWAAAREGATV